MSSITVAPARRRAAVVPKSSEVPASTRRWASASKRLVAVLLVGCRHPWTGRLPPRSIDGSSSTPRPIRPGIEPRPPSRSASVVAASPSTASHRSATRIPERSMLSAAASSARFSAQHVDARLARGSRAAGPRCAARPALHRARVEACAPPRADLYSRGRRADVRDRARCRRGDEVDRHRRACCRDRPSRSALDRGPATASEQRRVRRAVVRAGRRARVVGERRRRRQPAPEVLRVVERLADQRRADGLPVAHDQAAVALRGKDDLGDAGDDQRIDHAGDERSAGPAITIAGRSWFMCCSSCDATSQPSDAGSCR